MEYNNIYFDIFLNTSFIHTQAKALKNKIEIGRLIFLFRSLNLAVFLSVIPTAFIAPVRSTDRFGKKGSQPDPSTYTLW